MYNVKLLDCTLRDGGYINDWDFTSTQISSTMEHLTNANLDYIEIGYITSILGNVKGSQFLDVESASRMIPADRKCAKYVIMADVAQFDTDTLCHRTDSLIDGIRVVFYKRQIDQAISFCEKVCDKGYDLFLQPMVTVDYSHSEFERLINRFCTLYKPYAVSVVDSFGSMLREQMLEFVEILDANLSKDIRIGFHGHNNMLMTLTHATTIIKLAKSNVREFILDASINGMGRGAGNLCTELIASQINLYYNGNYDLNNLVYVMSEVTEPLTKTAKWGYSPYLLLTAMRCAHPNFATYLLDNHEVSVVDFSTYLSLIPDDMLTKCTRPYVEELYEQLSKYK